MIVFDLRCGGGHVFEAWFGSGADHDAQAARGLLACPLCDDTDVTKAAMAPAVPAKSNRAALPANLPPAADVKAALATLAKLQAHVEATSDYVGANFAAEARAIDAGAATERPIWGEATRAEAASLAADGIAAHPLPFRPRVKLDA